MSGYISFCICQFVYVIYGSTHLPIDCFVCQWPTLMDQLLENQFQTLMDINQVY